MSYFISRNYQCIYNEIRYKPVTTKQFDWFSLVLYVNQTHYTSINFFSVC